MFTGSKTWLKLLSTLNESNTRWYVAQKAIELGRGGIKTVHELTKISKTTIIAGMKELNSQENLISSQQTIRAPGGGRKTLEESQPKLRQAVLDILEENTAGDPMSSLKWTTKSTRNITDDLINQGFKTSRQKVYEIVRDEGYSLQANSKSIERSTAHPDRDEQFKYINEQCAKFKEENNPIISVDTKKKELVGNFKNSGKEWRPEKNTLKVNAYDFPSLAEGKAIPYGTYDLGRNEGFVNVGKTHDTAEFAVNSIDRWWQVMGKKNYKNAKNILICADGGGSNGSRNRLWKKELQDFANRRNIAVTVNHFPPGTSKWNKIEHKLFSFISINWRGKPLYTYDTVVNLIANTKTKSGLKVKSKLDKRVYKTGKKISNKELEEISIEYHSGNNKWNYTISPQEKSK
jgi:hypothetical protein